MRIRILLPILPSPVLAEKAAEEYREAAGGSAEISVAALRNGTRTIESDLDIALSQPETVRAAIEAERDGIDACIVACFSDPGVAAAREAVAIPVIGEGQAALHLAAMLAGRFSVITTWEQCRPRIRRLVGQAGFGPRLASVRAAGVGVMGLSNDCLDRLVDQAVRAARDDGAEAVVLGCTGTGENMAAAIERGVRAALGTAPAIVDPVPAALAAARSCAALGLSHSKVAYPTPRDRRPEYRFAVV
ncbi:MAG: aspartate/glutamate racemase family protein [Dongiaceae bacterium]